MTADQASAATPLLDTAGAPTTESNGVLRAPDPTMMTLPATDQPQPVTGSS